MEADVWQLWFDGAALPNPGKIGIGVVLVSPTGVRREKSCLAGVSGCNNEAELHALQAALAMAHDAGAQILTVRGDSDFVIRHASGRDATAIPRLTVLIAAVQAAMARFSAVTLIWIPRHRNQEADRLSRQALSLPHKPAPVPGKSIRKR